MNIPVDTLVEGDGHPDSLRSTGAGGATANMSESNNDVSMASGRSSNGSAPRAMIHRKILDAAESQPDASIQKIADDVAGATPELVEKVLDEYGDPAQEATDQQGTAGVTSQPTVPSSDDQQLENMTDNHDNQDLDGDTDDQTDATAASGSTDTADESGSTDTSDEPRSTDTAVESGLTVPNPETLTEIQLETLRAVHDRPTATQAELASEFDITAASVGQRVNAIEGFDWSERRAFTEAMFDSPAGTSGSADAESETTTDVAEAETETATSTAEAETETTTSTANAGNGTTPTGAETDGGTAQPTGGPEAGVDATAVDSGADDDVTTCECADEVEALAARIDRLDQRLAEQSPAASESLGPDLVHKVTHACMQSDQISEEEELRILRSLMGTDDN